jgi:hypothetical protein
VRLLYPARKRKNYWLAANPARIPLGPGVNLSDPDRTEAVQWMNYPVINGNMIHIFILICGTTGSGKSTLAKEVEWFLELERPLIKYDWRGRDAFLCHYANTRPGSLPENVTPSGIKGHYFFYPVGKTDEDLEEQLAAGAKRPKSYEVIVRPNLCKYGVTQWEALGLSPGAAQYLINMMRRYGPFQSLESLLEFVEHFPTNDAGNGRVLFQLKKGDLKLQHKHWYDPGDTMHAGSRDSIKKILPKLIQKNVFRLDGREDIDFDKLFLKGDTMVFSFNDDELARVEISYQFERIEYLEERHPAIPPYFVSIEEADKMFVDTEGAKVDKQIEEFVLRCRKLSIGLVLIMPQVLTLNSKVLDNVKYIITGKMDGDNAARIVKTSGGDYNYSTGYQSLHTIITNLRYNPFAPPELQREFLLIDKFFKKKCRFRPYDSPCEIHRETQQTTPAKTSG